MHIYYFASLRSIIIIKDDVHCQNEMKIKDGVVYIKNNNCLTLYKLCKNIIVSYISKSMNKQFLIQTQVSIKLRIFFPPLVILMLLTYQDFDI